MNIKEAYLSAHYKLGRHGTSSVKTLMEAMAAIGNDIEQDSYGEGPIINNFENKMAKLLGKEAAVFFPSGTMAQQIALRIWCDKKEVKRVAYHPLCHLEIHEKEGIKVLHGIETILLGASYRLFTIEDLRAVSTPLGAVLVELPQREIGGQLPTFEQLKELSNYCHERDIPLHMDGARLLETLPYYQKTAKEVCDLFDSVYISFYKGIGAITGALLAGSKDFCDTSKIWKRRHGGDLFSLFPYIVPADYCYELRKDKMPDYYHAAVQLAKKINTLPHTITVPEVPVSNMFHIHFDLPKEMIETILIGAYERTQVGIVANLNPNPIGCYAEFSAGDLLLNVPEEVIDVAIDLLNQILSNF